MNRALALAAAFIAAPLVLLPTAAAAGPCYFQGGLACYDAAVQTVRYVDCYLAECYGPVQYADDAADVGVHLVYCRPWYGAASYPCARAVAVDFGNDTDRLGGHSAFLANHVQGWALPTGVPVWYPVSVRAALDDVLP